VTTAYTELLLYLQELGAIAVHRRVHFGAQGFAGFSAQFLRIFYKQLKNIGYSVWPRAR